MFSLISLVCFCPKEFNCILINDYVHVHVHDVFKA